MDKRKENAMRVVDNTLMTIGCFHDRKVIETAVENDDREVAVDMIRQWIDRLECLKAYLSLNV